MDETGQYRKLMLRATGITKKFGALPALAGVDFEMPRHGIVSIIGPNGAGKSVLFNIITGVTKPDSGEVWFNGKPITRMQADRVTALGIARTFQNIRLFGNMTVLENVLVGQHSRMKHGIFGSVLRQSGQIAEEAAAYKKAWELLRFVGLDHLGQSYAANLPYGAGRRLEIARALATDPELLMLDEPTAGMNPQETSDVISLISSVRRDMGVAILLIEHDMRVVMRISDRISVLDYGVKIAEGTPDEIRSNARVIEAYLGRGAAAQRELAPDNSASSAPGSDAVESLQLNPKPAT